MMLELAACLQTLETRRQDVVSTIDRAIQRAIEELKAIAPLFDTAPASVEAPRLQGPLAVPRPARHKVTRRTAATPATTATRTTSAKPNGQPARARRGRPSTGFSAGAAIISALGASRAPMTPREVVRVTRLPRWKVMRLLLDMHADSQLLKIGQHRHATYTLPSQPRPGAVAGTQAAPPVGPPSATGARRPAAEGDVVWNGTKDRAGEAPTLVPPRERRP